MLNYNLISTKTFFVCSGYMAPEYVMHGQFSVKSDAFSFGVLLLEIVSGQKNNCFHRGENVENLLSSVKYNNFIMFYIQNCDIDNFIFQ